MNALLLYFSFIQKMESVEISLNFLLQDSHLYSLFPNGLHELWRCFFKYCVLKKWFATRVTFMIFVFVILQVFFQTENLQTLEIRKKLLQIYCYQNFCSNALTVTLFKSYCSNSNFVKKLLKSYCSNLLLQ